MKNLVIAIACIVLSAVGTSGYIDSRNEAALGAPVPSLVLEDIHGAEMSVESMKGKWVILSFWSAADAQSRLLKNRIDSFVRKTGLAGSADVSLISVNFDRSETLMNEIMCYDGQLAGTAVHVESPDMEHSLRGMFSMRESLRSFIVNPDGVLVVADPTEEDLTRIFG